MAERKKVKIKTPAFRASFMNVFKPRAAFEGKEPQYSVTMLFPKTTDLTDFKRGVRDVIVSTWGEDKTKWPKNLRTPFKDGDEKNLQGYKGMTVVEARSKQKPGLVDQSLQEITSPDEVYSGCWMRATVTLYSYDVQGNKGVAVGLQNLQKVKDDEAFSGKANAKDDFEELEELKDVDNSNDDIDF